MHIFCVFNGGLFVDKKSQLVDMFLMNTGKYFPAERQQILRSRLEGMTESQIVLATSVKLKDPTTLLIVSLLVGSLGVDRFMIGDTAMGVLKLLTVGLCGILTIVDWFTIGKKTRDLNFNNFMNATH